MEARVVHNLKAAYFGKLAQLFVIVDPIINLVANFILALLNKKEVLALIQLVRKYCARLVPSVLKFVK